MKPHRFPHNPGPRNQAPHNSQSPARFPTRNFQSPIRAHLNPAANLNISSNRPPPVIWHDAKSPVIWHDTSNEPPPVIWHDKNRVYIESDNNSPETRPGYAEIPKRMPDYSNPFPVMINHGKPVENKCQFSGNSGTSVKIIDYKPKDSFQENSTPKIIDRSKFTQGILQNEPPALIPREKSQSSMQNETNNERKSDSHRSRSRSPVNTESKKTSPKLPAKKSIAERLGPKPGSDIKLRKSSPPRRKSRDDSPKKSDRERKSSPKPRETSTKKKSPDRSRRKSSPGRRKSPNSSQKRSDKEQCLKSLGSL